MLTTFKMQPREAPLCLEHFLSFARLYSKAKSSEVLQTATPSPTPSPSPARVQPRRAAKNKHPIYSETAAQKRKIHENRSDSDDKEDDSSDDDEPRRGKRARLGDADASYEEPGQLSPNEHTATPPTALSQFKRRQLDAYITSLKRRIEEVARTIEGKYADKGTECVFVEKSFICSHCDEDKSRVIEKLGIAPLYKLRGLANTAKMEPWACRLLLK